MPIEAENSDSDKWSQESTSKCVLYRRTYWPHDSPGTVWCHPPEAKQTTAHSYRQNTFLPWPRSLCSRCRLLSWDALFPTSTSEIPLCPLSALRAHRPLGKANFSREGWQSVCLSVLANHRHSTNGVFVEMTSGARLNQWLQRLFNIPFKLSFGIKQSLIYNVYFSILPVLLRDNWYTSPKLKAYSMMVQFTYIVKWLPQQIQLTSIFSCMIQWSVCLTKIAAAVWLLAACQQLFQHFTCITLNITVTVDFYSFNRWRN